MGQAMMVKIIAPTLIKGVPVNPGTPDEPVIMELDAADAQILISNSKAERHTPVVEAVVDMAGALAQAKAELLERIAAAADIIALDDLLSEDPDVVAAYEQRLAELEEDHH